MIMTLMLKEFNVSLFYISIEPTYTDLTISNTYRDECHRDIVQSAKDKIRLRVGSGKRLCVYASTADLTGRTEGGWLPSSQFIMMLRGRDENRAVIDLNVILYTDFIKGVNLSEFLQKHLYGIKYKNWELT